MPTQSDIALLALNAKSSSYALTASFALNGGGGGGTPGGSDTQVQFNDAGTFQGSSSFTFDKNSNTLSVTGSTILSGSTFLFGLSNPSAPQVLTYTPSTGQVTYTASSAFGGAGSGPGGADTDIQFNNAGNLSGSRNFRFDGTNKVYLTGSISASSGTNTIGFFGTSSWSVSSSRAVAASSVSVIDDGTSVGSFEVIFTQTVGSAEELKADNGAFYYNPATKTLTVQNLNGTASWAKSASYLPEGIYQITSSWAGSASQALTASYINSPTFSTGSYTGSFTGIVSASNLSGSEFYVPRWGTTGYNLVSSNIWDSGSFINIGSTGGTTAKVTITDGNETIIPLSISKITGTQDAFKVVSSTSGTVVRINSSGGGNLLTVQSGAPLISRFIVGYNGSVYVSGSATGDGTGTTWSSSFSQIGELYFKSLTNTAQTNVLTYNPSTGQVFYTASSQVGGGGGSGTPGGPFTTIQFNDNGSFSGSGQFTFDKSTNKITLTGSIATTGSISASSGTNTVGFFGTASWAQSASQAISSSYSLSSSNAQTASFLPVGTYQITSSWAQSASNTINAQTASFLPVATYNITASWAQSASNAINSQTASFLPVATYNITASWAQSASQALTASFLPVGTYQITSSWAQSASQAISSSYSLTASYAINAGGSGFPFSGNAVITGSLLVSQSGIIVTGSVDVTGSISASSGTNTVGFFGTSSWAQSASQALTASFVDNVFLQGGNSFSTTATLGTNDTQNLAFETSGSTRMIISSSGVVGIGTASVYNQTASLHVAGNVLLGGTVAGFSNFSSIPVQVAGGFGVRGNMFLYNAGTNATSSITWGTAGVTAWVTRNEGSSSFRFITGSTILYNMSSSGLGILKDRNNAALDVNGNTILSGSLLVSGSSTLTGSMFVTGAISASFGTNTVGFFGTASWAESASQAISSSYALVAATANNIPTAVITSSIASGFPYMYSLIPRAAGGIDDNLVQNSIFLGLDAGTSASIAGISGANNSIFIGQYAGVSASSAGSSVFLGGNAGSGSAKAVSSYFIGSFAGALSPEAFSSINIGEYAGFAAISASNSIFLGSKAGDKAVSASFSILLGQRAGQSLSTTQESIGKNNIIIGNNLTLPYNTQHYANIGGALFISGTYSNTASLANAALFSGSVSSSRVGINKWNPSYSLDVSGSVAFANLTSASQTHIVTIDTSSGQLFFTASSAIGGGGSGFPFSGSAVVTGSFLVSQSGIIVTGSINVTGSISASFGSNTVGFFGTSSWTQTASYALGLTYSTSSVIGNGLSSSYNINHGFNTRNLHITVYESSSNGETVYPDIRRINENTASIIFANPPLSNQYIVYISI